MGDDGGIGGKPVTRAPVKGLVSFEEGAVTAIPQELTDKLSMLEGKQETYFEQWMRLAAEVKSAADSADEDGEILRKIELLMSDSSFMSLERPEAKAEQKVDEELMAGKLERFFGELSAAWEGKPKVLVRAVMSKILSRLPVFLIPWRKCVCMWKGASEAALM